MKKVLLVAPSDDFARAFGARLEEEGASVEHALNGSDALAVAIGGTELILIDLELPDLEGLTLLRALRNGKAPTIPILLLKGEVEPAHVVQRGFDLGASGYVIKHRLPGDLSSVRILENLTVASNGRRDACPFSSRHDFGRCSVFLPLSINLADDGEEPAVTCSHLRMGTSDTWRLYPRCAIGDQSARDRYLEDRAPV